MWYSLIQAWYVAHLRRNAAFRRGRVWNQTTYCMIIFIDNALNFVIPTAPLGVVSNVTVSVDSPSSVSLSWLPIPPSRWNGILSSYIIQYQRQGQAESTDTPASEYVTLSASIPSLPEHPLSNSPDPRLATLPLSEEMLLLEGLEENFVYEFTIYCENSAGRSETSDAVSIVMPPSGRIDNS